MKMLVAQSAGLGNRMQCIDSCIEVAKQLSLDLKMVWHLTPKLNCSLERLFRVPDGVEVIQVDTHRKYSSLLKDFACTHDINNDFFRENPPGSFRWDRDNFSKDDRILVTTSRRFLSPKMGGTNLEPSQTISSIVSSCLHLVDGCLGVHVRRTDHKVSISRSPTEDFFALLDARPNDECFFLSTDDVNEEQAFVQRYGDRVRIYRKRSRDRSDPVAIEDGLVDMLLLSKCTAIVASSGSTFSGCAAFIGNRLLHRVQRS
jgi:hypothetical protein